MKDTMLYPTDATVRLQAIDPLYSFIVQAPAGSGKTELLTQRFLALLATVREPEEIIAITFTRKAAAEMQARILQALTLAKTPEPQKAHLKLTWQLANSALKKNTELRWHLLENPTRLQIKTIDSLCLSLTQQLPLQAEFGCMPNIVENADHLYQLAANDFVQSLHQEYPWSEALARLSAHLNNRLDALSTLFVHLLAKRSQWQQYLYHHESPEILTDHLNASLLHVHRKFMHAVAKTATLDWQQEAWELLQFANQHTEKNSEQNSHTKNFDITAPTPPLFLKNSQEKDQLQTCCSFWQNVGDLCLTTLGEPRQKFDKRQGFPSQTSAKNPEQKAQFVEMKARAVNLCATLHKNFNLLTLLQEIQLAPPYQYESSQLEILMDMLACLPPLMAYCRVIFQKHRAIDFVEINLSANRALGTLEMPTDLTLNLENRIQHLLIDEFQDTASSQYQLLEKLTATWQPGDGHSLFLVGDPMQSIYRFRKAEVRLFLHVFHTGIGALRLIPLKLTSNFRSDNHLITWFNEVFSQVFPKQEDLTTSAIPYHAAQPMLFSTADPAVEVHAFDSQQSEALHFAKCIQQWQQIHPQQNIAILVKSRSHLLPILAELRNNHIAYQAIDIEPLAKLPHIQDLLSLATAITSLANRLSWFSVLRAPFCGLTLNDLHILAEGSVHTPIWQHLQDSKIVLQLSEDGQLRLSKIIPILQNALQQKRRVPLHRLLLETWHALQGPFCLDSNTLEKSLQDVEQLLEFLRAKEFANDCDWEWVLPQLTLLYAKPQTDTKSLVQVMTIHKSKGLEFDKVIILGLDKTTRKEAKQLFLWQEEVIERDINLLLAPICRLTEKKNDRIYDYIQRVEQAKGQQENIRLLYVAATRAKSQLHLSAVLKRDLQQEIQVPKAESLLAPLWPILQDSFIKALTKTENNSLSKKLPNIFIEKITRPWQRFAIQAMPETHPGTKAEATAYNSPVRSTIFTQEVVQTPEYSAATAELYFAQKLGTFIHGLLEHIARQGYEHWQKIFFSAAFPFARRYLPALKTFCIEKEKLEFALAQIEGTLSNIAHCSKAQWFFSYRTQAHSELAIQTSFQQHIIDRTFVDETNTRWIIDFKTSGLPVLPIDEFYQQQIRKYHLQLERYAQVLNQQQALPTQLALYYPLFCGWVTWKYGSL